MSRTCSSCGLTGYAPRLDNKSRMSRERSPAFAARQTRCWTNWPVTSGRPTAAREREQVWAEMTRVAEGEACTGRERLFVRWPSPVTRRSHAAEDAGLPDGRRSGVVERAARMAGPRGGRARFVPRPGTAMAGGPRLAPRGQPRGRAVRHAGPAATVARKGGPSDRPPHTAAQTSMRWVAGSDTPCRPSSATTKTTAST